MAVAASVEIALYDEALNVHKGPQTESPTVFVH